MATVSLSTFKSRFRLNVMWPTGNNHTGYFTMTVVASMSPNGLTLLTSLSTTELSSVP